MESGHTTYDFTLDDNVIEKCGINGKNYEIFGPQEIRYQKVQFAVGYEKVDLGNWWDDQGVHYNVECLIQLSGAVQDQYTVNSIRGNSTWNSNVQVRV